MAQYLVGMLLSQTCHKPNTIRYNTFLTLQVATMIHTCVLENKSRIYKVNKIAQLATCMQLLMYLQTLWRRGVWGPWARGGGRATGTRRRRAAPWRVSGGWRCSAAAPPSTSTPSTPGTAWRRPHPCYSTPVSSQTCINCIIVPTIYKGLFINIVEVALCCKVHYYLLHPSIWSKCFIQFRKCSLKAR